MITPNKYTYAKPKLIACFRGPWNTGIVGLRRLVTFFFFLQAQDLGDQITLLSRGPIPYTMTPYLVYEPQTLLGFMSSLRLGWLGSESSLSPKPRDPKLLRVLFGKDGFLKNPGRLTWPELSPCCTPYNCCLQDDLDSRHRLHLPGAQR